MEANSHHDKELYNQIEEAYGKSYLLIYYADNPCRTTL